MMIDPRLTKYSSLLTAVAACATLFAGCGGSPVLQEPTAIPEAYVNPVFTPLPSVLSVPVVIQPSWLENLANEQSKEELFRNDTLTIIPGISSAQLVVYKSDRITIGLLGDELHYRVPLRLHLRIAVGVNTLGIHANQYQDFDAGIALRMRSTIKMNSDWSLSTSTVSEGYDWTSNPVIKAGGLSIPVKPVADLVLFATGGSLGRMVDNIHARNRNLKNRQK